MPKETTGAAFTGHGRDDERFISLKRMTTMAIMKPKNWAPVSPRKILFLTDHRLYRRNAIMEPMADAQSRAKE